MTQAIPSRKPAMNWLIMEAIAAKSFMKRENTSFRNLYSWAVLAVAGIAVFAYAFILGRTLDF